MNNHKVPSPSTRLLEQAAMLLEAYKQEAASLHRQMADATARIDGAASRLAGGGERLGREALQVIEGHSHATMSDSAARAFSPLRQQAESTMKNLERATQAAAEQGRQLRAAQSALVWKSLAVLGVGALALAAGSGWWAWSNYQQVQQYRMDADIGRRLAQADIVRCGEGLCANVDARAPAAGERRQYLVVRPRVR